MASRNTRKKKKSRNSFSALEPTHHIQPEPVAHTRGQGRLIQAVSQFSGPIPAPETIEHYDAVLPGSADRIVTMAEKQSDHRQKLENRTNLHDIIRAYAGVSCALVVTLVIVWLGYHLVLAGHDWAGTTIIITDLVALVGVFIYGTQTRKQQLSGRQEASDRIIRPR